MNSFFKNERKTKSISEMSLDFKLMFIFHIAMMVLFATTILPNPIHQVYLAVGLAGILIIISIAHKVKSNWSWPGFTASGLLLALFNLAFIYVFLAFSANLLGFAQSGFELNVNNVATVLSEAPDAILHAASNPRLTPWYLGAMGIGFMNVVTSLKLATLNKEDFEAQCAGS